MEWISVKDRMPEKSGNYLCTIVKCFRWTPQKCLRILWFDHLNKCWTCENCDGIITHWMPLPEFPKEIII